MKAPRPPEQMDLLAWAPPEPVRRFEEHRVRAATLRERLARAIAAALKDADAAGIGREEIAVRMSEYLGERVSKNMLDAYASQAREDHVISVVRLMALLHATRDARLLELLAEPLGWVVIDRKYLPLIELAAVRDQADALKRRAKEIRRQVRRGGAL
jgi:hypothetical protein